MRGRWTKIIVTEDRSWWLHPYGIGFYCLGAVVLLVKSMQWAFGL